MTLNMQTELSIDLSDYATTASTYTNTEVDTLLDAKVSNDYDAVLNATEYTSKTGAWQEDANSVIWSNDLHIDNIGYMMNDDPGTVKYQFPVGYEGGSAYLNYLTWSNGGYFDGCAMNSSNDAIFITRVNTYQNVSNQTETIQA